MKKNNTEYFMSKKVGRAINRYNMIEARDKILVGVSGGKDSLTLLKILQERKKRLPIDYTVRAIHIITDYDKKPQVEKDRLVEYFESLGCEYMFREIAFEKKNKLEKRDCFFCSWNRRKALFEAADETGFRKVALGHHKDDIAETILMNMIYSGELSSVNPVQELFGGKIKIIKPLIFLEEEEIIRYVKELNIPEIKSTCPMNKRSKRALVKNIIKQLDEEDQDIKSNILRAPFRRKEDYLTDVLEDGTGGLRNEE